MAEKDDASAPETDDTAEKSGSEDPGKARSGLEGILSEWEEDFEDRREPKPDKRDAGAEKPKGDRKPTAEDLQEVVDWARSVKQQDEQRQQEESRQQTEKALSDAAKRLSDTDPTLADLGERALKGIVMQSVIEDERIARVYLNRDRSPKSWERVLDQIASDEVAARNNKQDRKATEDREAARQSVAGSRAKQADESEEFEQRINDMSDAQFAKWEKKQTTSGLVR